METNQIIFDGKSYTILQTFYRTIGSFQQQLTITRNSNTEPRRTFYLVEHNKQLFWVKEYIDPALCHDINFEFAETNRLHSITQIEHHEIRTVKMLCVENGRLLMEYCNDYTKLGETTLTNDQKATVAKLIKKWLKEHQGVRNYDMCKNNTLIKITDHISIILIDFELSPVTTANERRITDQKRTIFLRSLEI